MGRGRSIVVVIAWLALAALAPSTHADEPERFALLVGETDYIQPADYAVTILKGPANDVTAIRQLLIDRYRFKPDTAHIRVITGSAASRKGIEEAFRGQLVENAKRHPNAVVVFYYSGHGSTTMDLNGDEGDGVDETLVAYDSRGPNGEDIVDDDVDNWLSQLRQYTSNITVILDSCHSGTATRGDEASRSLPPNPHMPQPATPREAAADPTPHLLRRKTYTAVAAAMASESSYENSIAAGGGKVHGYLTWFLVRALDRRPNLTWRQAINEIQRGVGSATLAQHPQAEGALDRVAFGLPDQQATPYVRLTSQDPAGNITVAAGVAQGVKEGGTLAIYAPSTQLLTGDAGRVATARVTFAGLSASRAIVVDRTSPTLPADAKVTIVTPFFGTERLQVRLDALPDQATSTSDLAILAAVRAHVAGSAVVTAGIGSAPWELAIQKGCPDGDGMPRVVATLAGCTAPVFYLAGRLNRNAVLARYIPVETPDAADRLAAALEQYARLNGLRALSNDSSTLNLSLEMLRQEVRENPAGELIVGATSPIPNPSTPLTVRVDDWFTFKVTNHSTKDVYAALLILNASGSIAVVSEAPNGDLVKAGKSMVFTTPIRAGLPLGIDTYKVIATTKPDVDFSVLETPDQARAAVASPLQTFLAAAATTRSKEGNPARDVKFGEWTTAQVDVKLLPKLGGTTP